MKRFIYLSVIVLLFSSCGETKRKTSSNVVKTAKAMPVEKAALKKEFPALEEGAVELTEKAFGNVIELVGEPVATNAVFRPREVQMLVKDDYLVMKNYSNEKMIRIFTLPGMKQVYSLGSRGPGPGEFLLPRLVETNEKDKLCYIHDTSNEKVWALKKNGIVEECKIKLPRKASRNYGRKQVGALGHHDCMYVGNVKGGKGVFHLQSDTIPEKTLVKQLGFSKDFRSWAAYIGDFAVNQEKDRMVYAYKYFKRLIFTDLKGEKQRTLTFKDAKGPKRGDTKSFLAPSTLTHYWGRSANSDRVYFLYSGRTPLQVTRENQRNKEYIFVEEYDWNGNPLRKFKLDKWGYFCVDQKRNTIYIAATNAVDPIYAFHIPN
ncbi:MAG: hypothetical protein ACEPOZ_13060 [Marinifilaceae bacterium]